MFDHFGVGVGEVVGDKDGVVLELELVLEGKCVVVLVGCRPAVHFSTDIALAVGYLIADEVPVCVLSLLQFSGEGDWPDSIQEHELLLNKVNDVDLHPLHAPIANGEVKPLVIPRRVSIILHDEIELVDRTAHIAESILQVAGLEARVENGRVGLLLA